jgi:hypothetical protein
MYKTVLFYLFLVLSLHGYSDFIYNLDISSKSVMEKEAVIIDVKLKQKNAQDVIHFDFTFPESDRYKIKLLQSDESEDLKGRSLIRSKYVLYPLKDGKLEIKPQLIVKKASKEELKKFVTGSADELMYMQTRNKNIDLKPFNIDVRKLDDDVVLVGDYELKYKIDKKIINSSEQVNITYILSGKGYEVDFHTILKEIPNVDLFINREVVDRKLSHSYKYMYAIYAENDFIIPEVSLVGYNPKTAKKYLLKAPPINIKVEKKSLTEDKNLKSADNSFEWKRYLNYFLLFLSGFLVQKLLKLLPKRELSENEKFIFSVKRAKTAKELLKILMLQDSSKFKPYIEKLEQSIYQDRSISLSSLKSDIIKRFSTFV